MWHDDRIRAWTRPVSSRLMVPRLQGLFHLVQSQAAAAQLTPERDHTAQRQ